MWALHKQMFKRCVQLGLQANMVNMAVVIVGVLSRDSFCAIEVQRRLCVDDSWYLTFAVTFHATSRSVENACFEASIKHSIRAASHVSENETSAVFLEIAEEEQSLVGTIWRVC